MMKAARESADAIALADFGMVSGPPTDSELEVGERRRSEVPPATPSLHDACARIHRQLGSNMRLRDLTPDASARRRSVEHTPHTNARPGSAATGTPLLNLLEPSYYEVDPGSQIPAFRIPDPLPERARDENSCPVTQPPHSPLKQAAAAAASKQQTAASRPPVEARQTNGSQTNGSQTDGSQTNGSQTDGSQASRSQTTGSGARGLKAAAGAGGGDRGEVRPALVPLPATRAPAHPSTRQQDWPDPRLAVSQRWIHGIPPITTTRPVDCGPRPAAQGSEQTKARRIYPAPDGSQLHAPRRAAERAVDGRRRLAGGKAGGGAAFGSTRSRLVSWGSK